MSGGVLSEEGLRAIEEKEIRQSGSAGQMMFIPCYICGGRASDRHHLIGGTSNRKNSEKYGLVVYLCRSCHERAHRDNETRLALHRLGQRLFEEQGSREEFMRIFGKNYLEDEE